MESLKIVENVFLIGEKRMSNKRGHNAKIHKGMDTRKEHQNREDGTYKHCCRCDNWISLDLFSYDDYTWDKKHKLYKDCLKERNRLSYLEHKKNKVA